MSTVHFGISNCHFAIKKTANYYTPPVPMPGAIGMSVDPDINIITANVRTAIGTTSEHPTDIIDGGKKITLDIASLPIEFLTGILGYVQDDNGVLVEGKQVYVPFALLYETQTNSTSTRYSLIECVCKKPKYDCTTMSNSVSVNTRQLEIMSYPCIDTGYYGKSISKNINQTVFANWFKNVY